MSRFAALVVVEILIFAPLSASAKTLYVDGSAGNDSTTYAANGPSSPWRTIGRAAWGSANRSAPNAGQAALAGDTVRIATGTYTAALSTGTGRYDVLYNPVNSGTSGGAIVFVADGAVAVQAPAWGGPVIGASSRDHVRWTGPFLVDEAAILTAPDTGPVVFVNTTGSGVDGATIHGSGALWADNHVGVRFDSCNQCFVRNTRIDNFKSLQTATSRNGSGVMLYDSDDTLIEHNDISNCGSGIYIKAVFLTSSQDRTVVRFNAIHDVLAQGLIMQHTTDGRVYQNVIRDNPIGILFSGDDRPGHHPRNGIVANNTLDGNGVGIEHKGIKESVRFLNNIITNANNAHHSDLEANPGDLDAERNDYFINPSGTFARFTGGEYSFPEWRSTFGQDAYSMTVNPMYVNPGSNDFRLSASSPVRNLGIDILDLDGDGSTTDTVNPGAYVSGAEVIGPGPIDPPGVPSGVRILRP